MSSRTASSHRGPTRGPQLRAALRVRLGVPEPSARAVLDAAREQRRIVLEAEAMLLVTAADWAALHVVDTVGDPETGEVLEVLPGREGASAVAGDGAPLVAEFCLAELGAALGVSTLAARSLVGDAVELSHRLPLTWEQLLAGRLDAHRARRIAARTAHLSLGAAAFTDEHVHGNAQGISLPAIERLVTEAEARLDPAAAASAAAEAAEHRHATLSKSDNRPDGLVDLDGLLDAADAADLDALISAVAHRLSSLHPGLSLDARRALALGYIARGQDVPDPDQEPDETPAPLRPRQAVLHLHLSESATRGTGGLARVEACGPAGSQVVVDADRVRAWLDVPHATVVVRPVLDVAEQLSTTAYEIPDRLHEQAVLRDQTCVFPWCTVLARRCDTDHVVPWHPPDADDPGGGTTTTDNLAPLCRSHHRHKTHTRWRLTALAPGRYQWTSPHGLAFLRDHAGTRALE